MKIYISGKISGLPTAAVEKKFDEAESLIRAEGHIPINPNKIVYEGLEYEDYMHIDFALIDVCDAVHMLPDWKDSDGAGRELDYAIEKGKFVRFAAGKENQDE